MLEDNYPTNQKKLLNQKIEPHTFIAIYIIKNLPADYLNWFLYLQSHF